MPRVALYIISLVMGISFLMPLTAHAATVPNWNPGYIIDDAVFTNNRSMTYDQIQAFLASKLASCDTLGSKKSEYGSDRTLTRAQYAASKGVSGPFPCLKDYVENGRNTAQIIYDVANQYRINPQILIVLLQKEQGLLTDDWPWPTQYRSATGYGCPDTAACDSQYYGLTNQVSWSAKMFRSIMDANPNWYTPYVLGNNFIQYNPVSSCSGTNVTITNRATQALYNYTPYQPNSAALNNAYGGGDSCSSYGNRNFYSYFTDWFGSPRGDYCLSNLNATSVSVAFGRDVPRGPELGKFIVTSGAATRCVEVHTWQSGFGSWASHIATNASSINAADSKIEYADLDGSGIDRPVLVSYRNTSSGKVEFHTWDSTLKQWSDHITSNAPTINPVISQISFADLNGDGKDEAVLAGTANGSTSTGKIEIHVWNQGFMTWKDHYITNSSTLDPGVSQVSFADLDGDGKDEGIVIGTGNGSTSTGKIEMHVWNQGFGSWKEHVVSNSSTLDPAVSQLSFADVDGDKKDEGVLIGLKRAGSGSGNIEMHVWNQGFGSWKSHYITNQVVIQ